MLAFWQMVRYASDASTLLSVDRSSLGIAPARPLDAHPAESDSRALCRRDNDSEGRARARENPRPAVPCPPHSMCRTSFFGYMALRCCSCILPFFVLSSASLSLAPPPLSSSFPPHALPVDRRHASTEWRLGRSDFAYRLLLPPSPPMPSTGSPAPPGVNRCCATRQKGGA